MSLPCRCYVNEQETMETRGLQHSKSPLRVIVSRRRRCRI